MKLLKKIGHSLFAALNAVSCGDVVAPAATTSSIAGGGSTGSGGSDSGGDSASGVQLSNSSGGAGGTGGLYQGGSGDSDCPANDSKDYWFSISTNLFDERVNGFCTVEVIPDGPEISYRLNFDFGDVFKNVTLRVPATAPFAISLFEGQVVAVDFEVESSFWGNYWLSISSLEGAALIQAVQAGSLLAPHGLSPLGEFQEVTGVCEPQENNCGIVQRIGADIANSVYGGTLRILDGQYTADEAGHAEYFTKEATSTWDNGNCEGHPKGVWWSVLGGLGVNRCYPSSGCSEAVTCDPDTGVLFPTACLAENCDAPIGYCEGNAGSLDDVPAIGDSQL